MRDERVKLLRFADPQPGRTIGLAWRRTSPRKADFMALGEVIAETLGRRCRDAKTRCAANKKGGPKGRPLFLY